MSVHLSAASKRAASYPARGPEWSTSFSFQTVTGIGHEAGVNRRDPSSILRIDDLYYVWYTRSEGPSSWRKPGYDPAQRIFSWDMAEIWYASSPDGYDWTEQGCAVDRGEAGAYDSRTVCTPDVMHHDGRFYLVYQAATEPYGGSEETVGMAVAESVDGPWEKTPEPILRPMKGGEWFGDPDNYNKGHFRGLNHDPMLLFFKGKYHLYYKCGSSHHPGKPNEKYAGRDTRWGVAISDNPTGPYDHSPYNPVTNSGHETLLWPYKDGLAALLNRDGPERDTVQYTTDGVNFEPMGTAWNTPWAGGACRCEDTDAHPLKGIEWGLGHIDEGGSEWNYIVRFDADPHNSSTCPSYYPRKL
ncbi:glycoside hydrolase family 117 protein [Algisphaera agarilytica]|uniref:Glycosyl hydrolases family 43 n=1 Tax=Algisphaera agarilytica TaxID=1385975 RepID=A0A7X0H2Y3_9BACT|nr:family 43 glycosylhydrolase [Algisphaera agarilytica]MBB6428209.1 hypothetical protein [Algisphaera agarilytica]